MSMRLCWAAVLSASVAASSIGTALSAQVPELPSGARSQWVVEQPVEVVGWVIFDPTDVANALPSDLRFLTVSELAAQGIPWAEAFLATHEGQRSWGISFIELFWAATFTIDGRKPDWGKDGAAALWFAQVAPSDSSDVNLGQGTPLLVLAFSIPDSAYAVYMRGKGYEAIYGAASLAKGPEETWKGSFELSGVSVTVSCTPTGSIGGGPQARGMQTLVPPATSPGSDIVRIAFAGHREQRCKEAAPWSLQGTSPLGRGIVVEPSSFQFGYKMLGGTYVLERH